MMAEESFPDAASVWHPRLVATLPFPPSESDHPCKTGQISRTEAEKLVERTKKRWTWFSKAEINHHELGTLGYLPLEIREIILEFDICREIVGSPSQLAYKHGNGPAFDASSYNGKAWWNFRPNAAHLRRVSSTIKAEHDRVLFSKRRFGFDSPISLMRFLKQIKENWEHLRNLLIGVETKHNTLYTPNF